MTLMIATWLRNAEKKQLVRKCLYTPTYSWPFGEILMSLSQPLGPCFPAPAIWPGAAWLTGVWWINVFLGLQIQIASLDVFLTSCAKCQYLTIIVIIIIYYIYVCIIYIYILLTPDCNIVITSMSHDAMSNQPWPNMTSHWNSDISMWRYIWNFIYIYAMHIYIFLYLSIYIDTDLYGIIDIYREYIPYPCDTIICIEKTKEFYLPMNHFLSSRQFQAMGQASSSQDSSLGDGYHGKVRLGLWKLPSGYD